MITTLMPQYTQEEIKKFFLNSTTCTITLINSDILICSAYEQEDKVVLFHPVVIDGYVDEEQVFQYFFKKPNIASSDAFMVIDKNKILYANTLSSNFSVEYQNHVLQRHKQTMQENKADDVKTEEVDSSPKNVVSISKRLH